MNHNRENLYILWVIPYNAYTKMEEISQGQIKNYRVLKFQFFRPFSFFLRKGGGQTQANIIFLVARLVRKQATEAK